MGDFKENPKRPYEVPVPNKIRKRIAMHEKPGSFLAKFNKTSLHPWVAVLLKEAAKLRRGSMWSRFTNRIKKLSPFINW